MSPTWAHVAVRGSRLKRQDGVRGVACLQLGWLVALMACESEASKDRWPHFTNTSAIQPTAAKK